MDKRKQIIENVRVLDHFIAYMDGVLDGLKYRSTGADIEFECAEIAVKEIKRLLEDE